MARAKIHPDGWVISEAKAAEINDYLPDYIDVVILDEPDPSNELDTGYFIEKWVYDRYINNPESFGLHPASGLDQVFDPNTDSLITYRNDYRLWTHVPEELHDKPVTTINYKTEINGRLQPVITNHNKGEVLEITYYAEVFRDPLGGLYGTEPIVQEEYVYFREEQSGLITHRTQQLHYFYEDGTEQVPKEKLRVKHYTPEEAFGVGERRRKNTIDFLKAPVAAMISVTEQVDTTTAFVYGSLFLNSIEEEIESFIKNPKFYALPQAVLNITTAQYPWIDNIVIPSGGSSLFGTAPPDINVTIRGYVLDQINIDG